MTPATGGPPSDVPLVFVDDLDAPALDTADRHHLGRVLRVADGAPITIADGAGEWRAARFDDVVVPLGERFVEPFLPPPITIAFALVKGDRPELVVQKLTELGADAIVPFIAARSVVRWDYARAARNVDRLQRVAREAAMQCKRARLPIVEPLRAFADVVARDGAVLAERNGAPPSLAAPTVLIGPEGGWTAEEHAAARGTVGLATHVLRAETAAIAACTLLASLRAQADAPRA
ncbi:MAG TPA: RsmE family RNA methyltransferase [Acidimicrobiales bacterium]|nr:RsmE family RNA methyltransferase [Acidimicrobiales bacterium]